MTGGSLPRAFRDVCQQTTLAASGRSIVTLYLRHILRPLCRQFPQIGEWNTAKIAVEESETHDRHLPAPIRGASGDLPDGPQQTGFKIVRSVALC